MTPHVGEELRLLRQRNGLTLEQAAERSGLSPRTIGALERGESSAPLLRTLRAISDAYSVDETTRARLLSHAREHRLADTTSLMRSPLAPPRVSDFVGRETELQMLSELSKENLTVTVSGTGGVGKTSFVMRAVDLSAAQRPRYFVDLDGLGSSPLTPLQALQSLLAQSAQPGVVHLSLEAAASAWREVCDRENPVLVLDSTRDEDQVLPVITASTSSRVYITSRRSLTGIPEAFSIHLEAFTTSESIEMLRRVIPETQYEDSSLHALAQLSGGMPLALRIAGNRVASRPHNTAGGLAERIGLEERRLRTLVAGDLSIEATFSLSYADLSPHSSHIFRTLGVIEGTTFDAHIAAAALDAQLAEVEAELKALVALGLLDPRGERRYRMHDLVRLFAAQRLEADESEQARNLARSRLQNWLLSTLERAGAWFEPGRDASENTAGARTFAGQPEARAWLLLEVDHWWPAYRAVAAAGRHAQIVDSADALHWFSDLWQEWGRWFEFYSLSAEAAASLGDATEEAKHLGYLAWTLIVERADLPAALRTAERALLAATVSGDEDQLGWAHYYIAWASRWMTDFERAAVAIRSAIRHFSRTEDREALQQSVFMNALIEGRRGNTESSISALEDLLQSMNEESRTNNSAMLAFTRVTLMDGLAKVLRETGRHAASRATARTALAIAEDFDLRLGVALSLRNLALVRHLEGDTREAIQHANRARELLMADGSHHAKLIREDLAALQ